MKYGRHIILLTVITIAAVTTILFYTGALPGALNGGDYTHDVNNPLHEAVVLYYRNEKSDAKRLLLRLARQEKYAAHAYLNYGLFLEREGENDDAIDYYRKALSKGEHIALFFIMTQAGRSTSPVPDHAFTAAGNLATSDTACWVDYRRAEELLLKNDRDGAFRHLSSAVDKGLPLTQLMYWDPLMRSLQNDGRFRNLIARAGKNNSRYRPLTREMEKEQFNHFKNSPRGMSRELMKVFALEPKEESKAEEMLTPLLTVPQDPRDRAVTLYWLARLRAKKKDMGGAAKYLSRFKQHIRSSGRDATGFTAIARKIEEDLYANDPLLKNVK